jgi:mRNA-degrading endonuclease toxin of MazEF toxin-antitoxin module
MRHGRGQITMHLEVAPDRVVVGVQDQGPRPPTPRQPDMTDVNGRGLALVAILATSGASARGRAGARSSGAFLTPAVSG